MAVAVAGIHMADAEDLGNHVAAATLEDFGMLVDTAAEVDLDILVADNRVPVAGMNSVAVVAIDLDFPGRKLVVAVSNRAGFLERVLLVQ